MECGDLSDVQLDQETSNHGRRRSTDEVLGINDEEDKQDSIISERVSNNEVHMGGSRSDDGRYHRQQRGVSEDDDDAIEN